MQSTFLHSPQRLVSLLLTLAVLDFPANAARSEATTLSGPPQVGRGTTAIKQQSPTDADIFRCRAFLEPLVPIGGTTTLDENIALQSAVESSARRKDQDDYSAILAFLERYPKS